MKLDEGQEDIRAKVFEAVVPETARLAKDVFGNFVVQKLFEKGDLEQKAALNTKVQGSVMDLACHKYACRVMQKAVECLGEDQQLKIAEELKGNVVACIENLHGNHVIQKCIAHMKPENLSFIIDPVSESVDFVCTHMYGCRIAQRLLERCQAHHLEKLIQSLIPSAVGKLAKDKHGNYVIQCLLAHGTTIDKQRIIEVITTDIVNYCKNKISSNVVEKCFEVSCREADAQDLRDQRRTLLNKLLGETDNEQSPLVQIMNDKFGNYIVQSLIKHSRGMDPEDRELIQQRLENLEDKLQETSTGQHILACLNKEFRENP
jgi:hypothetical protein